MKGLGGGMRKSQAHLYADTLDAVAKLWADSLHNGNGTILVQVNLQQIYRSHPL